MQFQSDYFNAYHNLKLTRGMSCDRTSFDTHDYRLIGTQSTSVETAIGINPAVTPWRFVDIPLAPHPRLV